ncbi:thrombopoietin receptor isoform X2 [Micropterus dolomieu]|uniref:thrombopoietin receptor isoform X2 n=1 Tax=Micropterus dolomieu TaxID=147949 RepID=UPI001E8E494B|nr:thrombopoietin receptor isoform X2 [Micropterus dolomieu]
MPCWFRIHNYSYQSTMNWPCRWEMLLITLWIQVGFMPGIHCKDGTVSHLLREDVLLLKDEQDPKCFTRTQEDFTCFFETADNRTYDFLYVFDSQSGKKRCDMSVQATEEGTFLYICSFPAEDVLLYSWIHLDVEVHNTSTILYNRTVAVEDHILLDPPFNVSLQQNGQVGQLQVSWHTDVSKYMKGNVMYRIRYSSKGLGEKTKDEAKEGDVLVSLVPGEEVEVQVTVKCAPDTNAGHWSSWSHPVQAMVPQRADDVSLMCYTSDMQNITCQWNTSRYGEKKEYKLFYKMSLSEALGWTDWTECHADRNLTELCRFRGDESRKVRIKLSGTPSPLSRTFYIQKFTLNNSIKTSPPSHLRGALEKDKLCLKWDAPLQSLSAHLQYEVDYQIRGGEARMRVSLNSPCLEVPIGGRYSVKLRAKPSGSIYSGDWSDWSDVLTGEPPTNIGTLLMLCIPVPLLITAIILLSLIYTHLSKLKQYFWPPVPNLDKVLQGFLKEINGQRWNPPIMAKQCSEETTSSVVEVMSEEDSGLGKPSEEFTEFLLPESGFSSNEHVDGSPGTEVFPDYVTLSKDSVIVCPNGNYVYKQVGEKEGPEVRNELLQTCHSSCTNGSVYTPLCLGTDFLNHSYFPLAEPADKFNCKVTAARRPGNLYTNFPSS